MRFVTLLCALAALARPLSADAIYDVGSNTTFASFSAAFAQALVDQPGPFAVTARVRVLDNSVGAADLDYAVLPLQPQAGAPLVLESGPGITAVLQGAGAYGVRIVGVANVVVQNLAVQGFNVASARFFSAPGGQLLNNQLEGAGAAAVEAYGSAGLRVQGNSLAPNAGTAVLVSGCAGAMVSDNLLSAGSASYGLVLMHSDAARMLRNRADRADYAFNVFSCNGVSVSANVAIGRGRQRGLVLDNAPDTAVLLNLLVGQDVGIELQSSPNCSLYHNTVWEHSTAGLYAGAGSTGMQLRNNLWQGFIAYFLNSAVQGSASSNNNGFRFTGQLAVGSGSYPGLSDWQLAGQDGTAIVAEPLFAQLAGTEPEHFKLQAGSPMAGYGTDIYSALQRDYFGNYLAPAPAPWDPGIHAVSAAQNTPTVTPTATPVLPTATPTATMTPTVTPSFTHSPVGTATSTPSPTLTATITPTFTLTPYPFKRDRVISYPNPWSPASGRQLNIVFEPAERATVRLFDMAGELLIELPGSALQASLGAAFWDGKDRNGALVPSGLYLAVVSTPKGTRFVRFTVLH